MRLLWSPCLASQVLAEVPSSPAGQKTFEGSEYLESELLAEDVISALARDIGMSEDPKEG